MPMTAKIAEVDHGMDIELKVLGAFRGKVVDVGFFEGDRHVGKNGKPDADLVLIAAANEYGADIKNGWGRGIHITIPERSFMRSWAIAKQTQISELMESLAKKVTNKAMDADLALKTLGVFGMDGIKKQIAAPEGVSWPPNADSTIKRKGSSHPLIDTGVLRESVRYQVRTPE
jgi:hypothetical protein